MDEATPAPIRDESSAGGVPLAEEAAVPARSGHALQAVESVQTVFTALALAFIFRAFLIEAFIIPTGSMAQSLLGAHSTRTCPSCGWEFDFMPAAESFCPNCHTRAPVPEGVEASKAGDRILVHKWPFVLGGAFAPAPWDVIVFRNPSDPNENYIKRLVGLPGQTVEIVDGDVYIDGHILRKPPAAQSVLWFIVYDQNCCPHPHAPLVGGARWVPDAPAREGGPGWSGMQTRVLSCGGIDEQERSIRFAPRIDEEYFEDVYAYDRGPSRPDAPYVRDMRIVGELTFGAGEGACRWELTRDGRRFVAELRRDGATSLTLYPADPSGSIRRLSGGPLGRFREGRPYLVEFGHLDYRVYLKIDGREILTTGDADYAPDLEALRQMTRPSPLKLRIGVTGVELDVRGLRVDRDVYYTYRERFTKRASAGCPFELGPDEYFVLGDNSPDSRDSREWDDRGPQLPETYRIGTVVSDEIVGPASFVYLPGLLALDSSNLLRLPDVGRMRFVR